MLRRLSMTKPAEPRTDGFRRIGPDKIHVRAAELTFGFSYLRRPSSETAFPLNQTQRVGQGRL